MTTSDALAPNRPRLLSKVPEVTLFFWIIKVLCTTVGESAADFLDVDLDLGLTGVSALTAALLVVALIAQFRADRYRPVRYWTTVALVSVFGTLVTDNLTDQVGVPLEASTLGFAALLAATFLAWYRSEKTLSIHSVVTRRRELYYWCAILFTFALGTAAGDLMAEVLGLGYLPTGLLVAALIAVFVVGWRLGLDPILSFWAIYVLTRPLGASIGDFLSQPAEQGGVGLGSTTTSLVFVVGIVGIVSYLAVTKKDVIQRGDTQVAATPGHGGLRQTLIVVVLLVIAGGAGYGARTAALDTAAADSVPATPGGAVAPAGAVPGASGQPPRVSALGDLSRFRATTQHTLDLLDGGDQAGATAYVDNLEVEWDDAEARLKPRDKTAWTAVDGRIDTVLRELRATNPNPNTEREALAALLAALS